MATSCDDGRFVCLLANEAGKGDALQHGHLFIFLVTLGLVPVGARNHGPTQVLLSFGDILPLSIKAASPAPERLTLPSGLNQRTTSGLVAQLAP